jgi:hypothetical protein
VFRPPTGQSRPSLRPVAAAFVAAFLRYEVGDLGPSVRTAIDAVATPHFAHYLLDHPPRVLGAAGRALPRASLSRLSIDRLPRAPDRALISGTAVRRSGPEEFSFLFELQHHRWRVLGSAE